MESHPDDLHLALALADAADALSMQRYRSEDLVVPVGRPVFFDIETTDVIHSLRVVRFD